MNILVVQTTRMGDMLQTSPLIRMLRRRWPKARITAMVRGMGRIIGERHPDLDDTLVYNEDAMFADMRSRDSDRLLKAYQTADALVQDLRARQFDIAYNVTHSFSSAMLLRMAGIPEVVGADIGMHGEFVLRGAWANYFFTSVLNRDYNDLNLCDISRHFVSGAEPCRELVFELTQEDRNFSAQFFTENGIAEGDFIACMQLGASEKNKRWSEARFAELALLLRAQRNARILLLGVEDEAPLGAAFETHAPGVALHVFGKTTVPQVAALLERANVLITNDTGTMHLAAAVKCPIVLVSVGHVHYRETGPFGEGHAAIEWRKEHLGRSDLFTSEMEERQRITAAQVNAVLAHVLEAAPLHADLLSTVDVHITRFAPDGCLQFYPALARPLAQRDLLRTVYRGMWLGLLSEAPDTGDALRAMLSCYQLPDPATLRAWVQEYTEQFSALADLARQGINGTELLLQALRKTDLVRARQLVRELSALDEAARLHSELHPACRPLAMMARFERDNLEGAEPLALAETTRGIYEALQQRALGVVAQAQRVLG